MLLGAIPDPELADSDAGLSPGDALVFYTDGFTDAYAPDRIVSPDDLSAVLRPHAGHGARDIIDGMQRAFLDGGGGPEPRDDIVLLVLRV